MVNSITNQLNNNFSVDLEKNCKTKKFNAFLYDTISKVNFVAQCALAAVAICCVAGAITAAPWVPVVLVLSFLAVHYIQMDYVAPKKMETKLLAEVAKGCASQFQKLKNLSEEEIQKMLNEHAAVFDVTYSEEELQLLKEKNPDRPLSTLLPVLAQYCYYQSKVDAALPEIKSLEENPDLLSMQAKMHIFSSLEETVIPSALKAATLFYTLQHPTSPLHVIRDLGKLKIKSSVERLLDHWSFRDNAYLVLKNGQEISFGEALHASTHERPSVRNQEWMDHLQLNDSNIESERLPQQSAG